MAAKFFMQARRDRHRNRQKLLSVLKKNGYTDGEVIRIVDSVAGRTHSGKEAAAGEILALIAGGADKQDVLEAVARYADDRFPFPCK